MAGDQAISLTQSLCPSNSYNFFYVLLASISHIITLLSQLAEANLNLLLLASSNYFIKMLINITIKKNKITFKSSKLLKGYHATPFIPTSWASQL